MNQHTKDNKIQYDLVGRIDAITASQLEKALIKQLDDSKDNREIIINLGQVDFVSSAGMRVIYAGQKKAKAMGRKQYLTQVQKNVMSVFQMTGFHLIFDFISQEGDPIEDETDMEKKEL